MKWRALHEAFDHSRRAGHSWAAARGARESGGVVICSTMEQARRLIQETNCDAISVNFVESLRGRPRPMVVDNQVVSMMAAEIMRLEDRLERDQVAYAKLDRQLTEEVLVSTALRRLVQSLDELRAFAQVRGAFLALALIGRTVATVALVAGLRELGTEPYDPEVSRSRADELLLAFIDVPQASDAFEAMERWYA